MTHKKLVAKGVLSRETLDEGKVAIVKGARQKMPLVRIQMYKNSTQWLNLREICQAINVSEFMLLEWFSKEFKAMKICWSEKITQVIFPGYEAFIQQCVNDFIKDLSEKEGLDATHWNQ